MVNSGHEGRSIEIKHECCSYGCVDLRYIFFPLAADSEDYHIQDTNPEFEHNIV